MGSISRLVTVFWPTWCLVCLGRNLDQLVQEGNTLTGWSITNVSLPALTREWYLIFHRYLSYLSSLISWHISANLAPSSSEMNGRHGNRANEILMNTGIPNHQWKDVYKVDIQSGFSFQISEVAVGSCSGSKFTSTSTQAWQGVHQPDWSFCTSPSGFRSQMRPFQGPQLCGLKSWWIE